MNRCSALSFGFFSAASNAPINSALASNLTASSNPSSSHSLLQIKCHGQIKSIQVQLKSRAKLSTRIKSSGRVQQDKAR